MLLVNCHLTVLPDTRKAVTGSGEHQIIGVLVGKGVKVGVIVGVLDGVGVFEGV